MACLGGTREHPQIWYRFINDEAQRQVGRVDGCKVLGPKTNMRSCYGCPAYRGVDRMGVQHNGVVVRNGEPVPTSLTYEEWQRYDRFLEADDFEGLYAWMEILASGEKVWRLRNSGTLEWLEFWNRYIKDYRARHGRPPDRRTGRDRAAYMRQYRRQKRNPVRSTDNEITLEKTPR